MDERNFLFPLGHWVETGRETSRIWYKEGEGRWIYRRIWSLNFCHGIKRIFSVT